MNRLKKEAKRLRQEYLDLRERAKTALKQRQSRDFQEIHEKQEDLSNRIHGIMALIPDQLEKAQSDFVNNGINASKHSLKILRSYNQVPFFNKSIPYGGHVIKI